MQLEEPGEISAALGCTAGTAVKRQLGISQDVLLTKHLHTSSASTGNAKRPKIRVLLPAAQGLAEERDQTLLGMERARALVPPGSSCAHGGAGRTHPLEGLLRSRTGTEPARGSPTLPSFLSFHSILHETD